MYAFVQVDKQKLPNFDDQDFALDLLEEKHILLAPGSSFNVPYNDHFRITLLPRAEEMTELFERIEDLLEDYANQERRASTMIKGPLVDGGMGPG